MESSHIGRQQKQAIQRMESSHKCSRNKPYRGWNQATKVTKTGHTEDGIKPHRQATETSHTENGIKPQMQQKQTIQRMESSHKGNENRPYRGWIQATKVTKTGHTEDGFKPQRQRKDLNK